MTTLVLGVKDDEQKVFVCHYPDVYNNEKITSSTSLNSGTCTINEIEKFRLKKDDVLIKQNLRIVRPGLGLPSNYYDVFLNKKVNRDLKKGTAVSWEILK